MANELSSFFQRMMQTIHQACSDVLSHIASACRVINCSRTMVTAIKEQCMFTEQSCTVAGGALTTSLMTRLGSSCFLMGPCL